MIFVFLGIDFIRIVVLRTFIRYILDIINELFFKQQLYPRRPNRWPFSAYLRRQSDAFSCVVIQNQSKLIMFCVNRISNMF